MFEVSSEALELIYDDEKRFENEIYDEQIARVAGLPATAECLGCDFSSLHHEKNLWLFTNRKVEVFPVKGKRTIGKLVLSSLYAEVLEETSEELTHLFHLHGRDVYGFLKITKINAKKVKVFFEI